ncbi:hypothetical protein [Spirosoma sp.]|uniref:hypothetical protein n=1 Tax=Spirosoma sp. TaxID=1899569 RepID=UPI00261E0BDD|nr:hypothetical protein [Spirosoma sp.]MCX6212943.1 hypothetical protein [Spirosoma sp.]
MTLPIENWLENQNYSKNITFLFTDSIVCYKSGAYRASLLFSYLGFLTILKERIVASNKSNIFPDGEWEKIISLLQEEDSWESAVFDATQQKEKIDSLTRVRSKDPIFSISENLRIQIKYWKDRRNDCAHYKDNIIDTYHVEAFWGFIQSNIYKITVEGGKNSLLNKFQRHYDLTYTPANKDVSPLIEQIDSSIDTSELDDFWSKLDLLIDPMGFNDPYLFKFYERVFLISTNRVIDSLIRFLKSNRSALRIYLSDYPSRVLMFFQSPEEVRRFWQTELKKCRLPLGIYASLLSNNLIPKNELEEANVHVFNNTENYTNVEFEHIILKENGFGNAIEKVLFQNKMFTSYLWVNSRADYIATFLEKYPLNNEIVKSLCDEYSKKNFSYWLLERLDLIFEKNLDFKNQFITIAEEISINIPAPINNLIK